MPIHELISGSLISVVLLASSMTHAANEADSGQEALPIFDAHIHYNSDVRDAISPESAIQRLRALGIERAMVSSTDDEGTQHLYRLAPDFVVPVLRPYRKPGTLQSWMYDESVIPYVKERLKKYRYAAIGEFHLEGNEANTPVIREIVALAKQYGIMLHVHSDARAIEFIFRQDPDARILWAHAGFEDHVITREMFDKHENLWADLSFRYDIMFLEEIDATWHKLLIEHADRFLLGLDTYEPLRWMEIEEVMHWQEIVLEELPDHAARKIAYENGAHMLEWFDDKQ